MLKNYKAISLLLHDEMPRESEATRAAGGRRSGVLAAATAWRAVSSVRTCIVLQLRDRRPSLRLVQSCGFCAELWFEYCVLGERVPRFAAIPTDVLLQNVLEAAATTSLQWCLPGLFCSA